MKTMPGSPCWKMRLIDGGAGRSPFERTQRRHSAADQFRCDRAEQHEHLSASIKTGEIMGASLTNRALTAATSGVGATASRVLGSTLGRRPLVVIRFDRKDVAYDQAIYNAVSRTLESRPGATFTLVAVAPQVARPRSRSTEIRHAGMQKMFFAHCSGWDGPDTAGRHIRTNRTGHKHRSSSLLEPAELLTSQMVASEFYRKHAGLHVQVESE